MRINEINDIKKYILEINEKDYINEEENDCFDKFLKRIEIRRKDDEKKQLNNNQNKDDNIPKSEYLYPLMENNSINEVKKDGDDLSNNYIENIQNNNKNIINCINKKSQKFLFLIILLLVFIFLITIILIICFNFKEDSNQYSNNYSKQYSFELVYYSDKDNENIKLINHSFIENIEKMEIDDEIIIPISEYNFIKKGNHKIYFNMKKNKINSMDSMFKDITKLKSIIFYPYINTYNINNMRNMFYGCSSLTSINISNFNTQNVRNMHSMFHDCQKLT